MKRMLLPVAVLVAVLAGCTPTSDPVAEPSSTPSATRTPTPTPTPEPEPTGPPALDELVIDGGVGTFLIGMDPSAQEPTTAFMTLGEIDCGGDVLTYWHDIYPERPFGNDVQTMIAGTSEGVVYGISIYGPGPRTTSGIGVGSTLLEAVAAYPAATIAATNIGRDRYVADLGTWTLVFDVNNGDTRWPDRVADTIATILVLPAGAQVGYPTNHVLC